MLRLMGVSAPSLHRESTDSLIHVHVCTTQYGSTVYTGMASIMCLRKFHLSLSVCGVLQC